MGCGGSAGKYEGEAKPAETKEAAAPATTQAATPAAPEAAPKAAADEKPVAAAPEAAPKAAAEPVAAAPEAAPKAAAEPVAAAPKVDKAKELAGDESMDMYFQELKAFTMEEMTDLVEIENLQAKGPESAKALVQKQTDMKSKRTAFKVKAERLLKEVFEAGDISEDGFLEPAESARVFAKIVNQNHDYLSVIAKEETRRMLAEELGVSRRLFEKMDVQDEAAVLKRLEEASKAEARSSAAEIDKRMTDALATYTAEKQYRDAAAFKVLDKSGDGKINKREWIDAFDTTHETYEKFLTALGLFDAPVVAAPAAEGS